MAAIGTRRERVLLELETNFPREAAVAAAAVAALNEEINHLGGSKTRGNLKAVGKDIEDTGRRADRAAPSIDKFSGRVNLLAKSIAAIGPSLIPISALAVPAITGLASSFGFAAIAGGTMIGAFQGVGDALKALNDAALEPTEAHLQAAREAMASISPEARKFVVELRTLQPELERLRNIAAAGMFPGMAEGLDQLTSALPAVQRIVAAVSGELGDIAADTGKSLGGERWADFFDFLAAEAPKALSDMAHGVGNVAHAMAELWMAFAPLNNSFSTWLVDSTADLDKWASGLAETEGFHEFVSYIQQNGPQVADTMGAIANAVLQIVEAAAPIGGPVLKVIEGLANAIANIADSDIGTPLFGMVAALSALNLAMSAGRGIQGKFAAQQATLVGGFQKQRASLRDLTTQWQAYQRVTAFQQGKTTSFGGAATLAQAEKFRATLRGTAIEAGKAGAFVGALALQTTGLGDKLGVSNTLMLAMAGSIIPGYGTAIGAAVGAVLDLAHANDDLKSAGKAAQAAMDSGRVDAMTAAYERLSAQIDDSKNNASGFEKAAKLVPVAGPYIAQLGHHIRGNEVDDQQAQLVKLKKSLEQGGGVDQLLHSLGALPPAFSLAGAAAAAAAEQLRANREAAGEMAKSFVGLGDSLNDSKVSLNGWIRDMAQMATALRQFTANSLVAANKGLRQGLIKELQAAGPEGARRMKQLADGTEKQIHRANKAWLSQRDAVRSAKDAIGGVPASKSTKFSAPGAAQAKAQIKAMRDEIQRLKDKSVHMDEKGAAQARARIAALRDAINSLHDKSVTVSYHRRNFGGPNAVAYGGIFSDNVQRYAYGDVANRHMPELAGPGPTRIWREPETEGEAYIPLANDDRRPRARAIAAETVSLLGGDVSWNARGSLTSAERRRHGNDPTPHVNHFAQALKEATKSLNKEKAARDDLISRRNDLRSTVSGNFLSDPFAGGNVWAAGGGNPLGILKADIAKANAFKSTLASLKKAGLDGNALASIASTGNIGQAQALLSGGKGGISQFESAFNQRAAAAAAVGNFAGNAAFGSAITATAHQVTQLNATVHRLEQQLKHRHAESQKNHKKNADHVKDGVTKGVNGAAGRAQRHRKGKVR